MILHIPLCAGGVTNLWSRKGNGLQQNMHRRLPRTLEGPYVVTLARNPFFLLLVRPISLSSLFFDRGDAPKQIRCSGRGTIVLIGDGYDNSCLEVCWDDKWIAGTAPTDERRRQAVSKV